MEKWTARELEKKFLDFFKSKQHAIIPSASLIPENDPTVLFTAAGMHPLVPFLLGQPHPLGKRLANNQKCLRTGDIDEVGDATHNTFFFMLGNWSLGDYFKKGAIEMSWEFLTSKEWLGLDKERLSVTVFEGDCDAPKDEESARVWKSLGVPDERIYYLPKEDNWWGPAGTTGPCGPDTEMFYDTLKEKCTPDCKPGCGCGKYFEIWNDVFMEYNKKADGSFEKLSQQNVDTGMGIERTLAMLLGKKSSYDTEMFLPILEAINKRSKNDLLKSKRIIADHVRSAVFVLGDPQGISPSNVEQGYVLRRLIRRSIRHARLLGIEGSFCREIAEIVVSIYGKWWPELEQNKERIYKELETEEARFSKALTQGVKEFNRIADKNNEITGKDAFLLYQSYGFPLEMTIELATERGFEVDKGVFEKEFEQHKETSRKGAEKKFKSGLADQSENTVALHTATHLLHAALRKVLGPKVQQKGSNITPERLRFDFSWHEKVPKEKLDEVEKIVNEQVEKGLSVKREEMPLSKAKEQGALAFFGEKYGDEKVSVYSIEGFSKEVCAGPHLETLKGMGHFKIKKEEAVAAGVRRIKAVLEK